MNYYTRLSKPKRVLLLSMTVAVLMLIAVLLFYSAMSGIHEEGLLEYLGRVGFPWRGYFIACAIAVPLALLAALTKDKPGTPDADREFSYADTDEYGTARVMGEQEARKLDMITVKPVRKTTGIILGQFDEKGRKTIALREDNKRINLHMLVFGPSRSGKTFGFVKPFLAQVCRRRESVCMSDPKGELFEDTSEYFRKFGYTVKIINFKEFEYSDGWDLISELGDPNDVARVQERAFLFANTVVNNSESNNDITKSGQVSLLTALLLYIYLKPDIDPTTETMMSLLSKDKEDLDAYMDELNANDPAFCAQGTYSAFRGSSPNFAGNTKAGLQNTLNPLLIDRVRQITSDEHGIDLSLPAKQPCAYYFIFPDQNRSYRFMTSLLFSFLFQDLVDYADAQPDRRGKVKVNVLLEEAMSVGVLPDFATKLSNIASRGISIITIFQNLQQLQTLYPYEWNSVIGNCSTHVGLGFNDDDTAKLFSDRAGAATINVNTERHDKIESILKIQNSENRGVGSRAVFTTDELRRLDQNECVIMLQGCNALKCNKLGITLHPDFDLMNHPVKASQVIPKIEDQEGRARYYEECQRRVEEYERLADMGEAPKHGYESGYTDDDEAEDNEETTLKDRFQNAAQSVKTAVQAEINRRSIVVLDSNQKFDSNKDVWTDANFTADDPEPESFGNVVDGLDTDSGFDFDVNDSQPGANPIDFDDLPSDPKPESPQPADPPPITQSEPEPDEYDDRLDDLDPLGDSSDLQEPDDLPDSAEEQQTPEPEPPKTKERMEQEPAPSSSAPHIPGMAGKQKKPSRYRTGTKDKKPKRTGAI